MKPWLTTQQVADQLGVSPQRVHALANRRDLMDKLSILTAGSRLWKPSTVKRLKPKPTGRPPES